MFLISAIDTSFFKKLLIPLFIFSFILLALVPIIGVEVNGAKRWLDIYFFRLQPIEILKPFFVLMTAKILTLENLKGPQLKYFVSFLLLILILILLVDQPDLGQSILLTGSWVFTVFISGVSILYIISFFSIFLILLSSLLFFLPEKFGYIINRLLTFFNPNQGDGFQSSSALDAIKLGGFTGRGMGEGYGSIVSILITSIFLYISFRIIKNCFNQDDVFLKISLCGLATLLIFQMFIHAGVNTNLIPATGMTLPFLSYGGSSLIGSAILAGIILNYSKSKAHYI
jgi:cell division protein FtsW